MIEIEKKIHFSYDLESTFTDEERKASEVLLAMKKDLKNEYYNITNKDFFSVLVRILLFNLFSQKSKILSCIRPY